MFRTLSGRDWGSLYRRTRDDWCLEIGQGGKDGGIVTAGPSLVCVRLQVVHHEIESAEKLTFYRHLARRLI